MNAGNCFLLLLLYTPKVFYIDTIHIFVLWIYPKCCIGMYKTVFNMTNKTIPSKKRTCFLFCFSLKRDKEKKNCQYDRLLQDKMSKQKLREYNKEKR